MEEGRRTLVESRATTIDVLKLFFSVCVLGIHSGVLLNVSDDVKWFIMHFVFRLAVPFFLCTSGYFLGNKLKKETEQSKKIYSLYRRKLIPSFLVWTIAGTFIYSIQLVNEGIGIFGVVARIIRSLLFYPMGAMWFVAACIVGSLIIERITQKKSRVVFIWIIGIIGYLFALLANTYFFLVDGTVIGIIVKVYLKICYSARNGVFVGVIFLWLGMRVAEIDLKDVKKINIWICFMLSLVFFVGEILYTNGKYVQDDSSLFVSFLILIPTGIMLALIYNIKAHLQYLKFRRMSTCIYYSHPFFNGLLGFFMETGILRFGIVLLLTIFFYLITERHTRFRKYLLP